MTRELNSAWDHEGHDRTHSDLFSVQFSSRGYPCAREGPYALYPFSVSGVSPNVALETVPMLVSLTDDGPFSSSQGTSLSVASFYASLLRAIDGVVSFLGCVPAGSVSSSSTLQILRDATTLRSGVFICYVHGNTPQTAIVMSIMTERRTHWLQFKWLESKNTIIYK